MSIAKKLFFPLFLLACWRGEAEDAKDFEVNLKDPIFVNGAISTDQGGIVTSEGLRIQAQKIQYINKTENGKQIKKIIAEGDLMMVYWDRVFVGSKLEYDFASNTGTLLDGKTFTDYWFLGGDKIELKEDGSYALYNAYITTCESQENTWDIHTSHISISDEHLLSAGAITLRFFKVPIFWLPSFKANLSSFKAPPIRYKLIWDKILGPRLSMRYRVYSWEDFSVFFRFDYRISRGPGAAIETDYHTPDEKTVFMTKTYGAYDKTVPDENGYRRYRLQGLYHVENSDKSTQLDITYDKLSDNKMPSDFKSDDFELDTRLRTRLHFSHEENIGFAFINVQPKINYFQSINQELPMVTMGLRPFNLGKSGILFENSMSAGFLDYEYMRGLSEFLPNTHAIRMESKNTLYRPIPIKHVTLTPSAGFIGIFYNNNPQNRSIGQAIFNYALTANTQFYRPYENWQHLVEPYITFQGYTRPTAPNSQHYIFYIDDGYAQMDELQFGFRNTFFSNRHKPAFNADVYARAFFDDKTFTRTIPKGYLDLSWQLPSLSFYANLCWNFQEQVLDYSNFRAGWTINENVALSAEFRHRSSYDWRKADHENFFLDMARPIDELLESPLSDRRDTLLTRLRLRLTPKWICQFSSKHGWGRSNEPRYNEESIHFYTPLTCSWQLRFGYTHSEDDDRFTINIHLMK